MRGQGSGGQGGEEGWTVVSVDSPIDPRGATRRVPGWLCLTGLYMESCFGKTYYLLQFYDLECLTHLLLHMKSIIVIERPYLVVGGWFSSEGQSTRWY